MEVAKKFKNRAIMIQHFYFHLSEENKDTNSIRYMYPGHTLVHYTLFIIPKIQKPHSFHQ